MHRRRAKTTLRLFFAHCDLTTNRHHKSGKNLRKIAGDALLGRLFEEVLAFATRLYHQKKNDKNKVHRIHVPEVVAA
jgi:hypothetical protein